MLLFFGLAFTVVWIGAIGYWAAIIQIPEDCDVNPDAIFAAVQCLRLNEFGDFLAGSFAVLAFFWLALAVLLQRQELSDTRKVLMAQEIEAKRTADYLERQSSILRDQYKLNSEQFQNQKTIELASRRALTVKLHEEFLNPDFYSKVRAPAFQVSLQWHHLPDEEVRSEFRRQVISGWELKAESDSKLSTYLETYPTDISEVVPLHFQKNLPATNSLTEHQALSSFLRFWTRLNVYLQKSLIDEDLT